MGARAAPLLLGGWAALALAALAALAAPPPRYSSRIVHTQAGAVRGVMVEVPWRRLEPVEAFLGVPYAGQPPRLGAPPPPAPWGGTRLADARAPACPQRLPLPVTANRSAALVHVPLGALLELERAAPLLAAQSEDCLRLDLYVPGSGARGEDAPYAVVVWAGGASHAWGGAALVDGAALAARGRLLVVAPGTRVGLLGFLTTGAPGDAASAAGGAGVLDALAALRWLRAHAQAFGGDPRRVTLVGARAGAALATALLAAPQAQGLVHGALLLSGSPLPPPPDLAAQRAHVARALGCRPSSSSTNGSADHWLARCVRGVPLEVLARASPPRLRFAPGWAPSPPALARALHASEAFLRCALAVVVCTTESYHFFSEDEIRHGFEEEHRGRVLRAFVRSGFRWHRTEILAAIRNEYTDWGRPIQHPINIRDATLEALSDGAAVAPAVRLARQHARRGATTFLGHFAHQPRDPPYPQRLGSVGGDAEAFFLGLPLLGAAGEGGHNYSRADVAVAEGAVALLAAFAKGGRPAAPPQPPWPQYDLASQQYLSIGARPRGRSHYRAHRLALWLSLLPQLHRPGAPAAHHQLPPAPGDEPDPTQDTLPVEMEVETHQAARGDEGDGGDEDEADAGQGGGSAEGADGCVPSAARPAPPAARPAQPAPPTSPAPPSPEAHRLGLALGATVCAGCALLALNALVLVALYAQRARARRPPSRRAARRPPPPDPDPDPDPDATLPRKSTLKRSSGRGHSQSPPPAPLHPSTTHTNKRVHIQEISV